MNLMKNNFMARLAGLIQSKHLCKSSSLRNELFIASVTRTSIFAKMSIQDQIVSLSRLIEMFQRDHGYMPNRPSRVLTKLNNKLNSQVLAGFTAAERIR